MKIAAKTNEGFLIHATEQELKSILTSFGMKDPEPKIGMEIPASDFYRQVNNLKNFGSSYDFNLLKEKVKTLSTAIDSVDNQLEAVSKV
jgi:hypothetical protein